MPRRRLALGIVLAAALLGVLVPGAVAAPKFRPRIGSALGIVPAVGSQEIALGTNLPIVYHGGSVMRNVTLHTIFWTPNGFAFDGPPSGSTLGYEQLVQHYMTDVAHDSGASSDLYSILPQYGDGSGPGAYSLHYSVAADSIDDTDAYPAAGNQCASAANVGTCVTDLQVEQEIDHVIQTDAPGQRGLGNIWLVFLPPDVDTCVEPGACGSNVFGGYHGLSNLAHGVTIYANIPDPLIEGAVAPGSDPQGNPDAETAIDAAAHEIAEAITNPEGDAWMDSDGEEVADKCEAGPQLGKPLGFAPDGSPYNEVIDSHQYLVQMMWSNATSGCVQRSSATHSALPLAQVNLRQFSSVVSGNTEVARAGIDVSVSLLHAGAYVAHGSTRTDAHGAWRVALKSLSRRSPHAVGDDRDEVDVDYGAGGPSDDVIVTGDGGNPFGEAGWTGWFDLDNGFAMLSAFGQGEIAVAPCSQTGGLTLTLDGVAIESPVDECETEADAAIVNTKALNERSVVTLASNDNRAVSPVSLNGALVDLTIPLGEPNSVSELVNPDVLISTTGFPSCDGDLHDGVVRCTGLVPDASYSLTRARGRSVLHARAGAAGTVRVAGFRGRPALTGGDVVTLRNGARRTLTTLHLAHLRVHIDGEQTTIASGTCQAGDYYGRPVTAPPVFDGIGQGIAGSGTICPLNGSAAGLPTANVEQLDDRSGGLTLTEVPEIENTAPVEDGTVYGSFVALAGAGLPGVKGAVVPSAARVSLTIRPSSGHHVIFRATNANTARGVVVRGLPAGIYTVTWVLSDANGDTRTMRTRFIERPAFAGRREARGRLSARSASPGP